MLISFFLASCRVVLMTLLLTFYVGSALGNKHSEDKSCFEEEKQKEIN